MQNETQTFLDQRTDTGSAEGGCSLGLGQESVGNIDGCLHMGAHIA